jgi:hypothetical protein
MPDIFIPDVLLQVFASPFLGKLVEKHAHLRRQRLTDERTVLMSQSCSEAVSLPRV